MFELWMGEKPFKTIMATSRDYLIAEEKIDFPIDMPDDSNHLKVILVR